MHIKRIDEMDNTGQTVSANAPKPNSGVMYRNNDYGTGETNPRNVVAFEMGELGNADIPDYLLSKYGGKMKPDAKSTLEKAVEKIEKHELGEDEAESVAKTIIDEMERIWRIRIANVLWLADYDAVVDIYDGNEDNIEEYPTSEYILSDLGGDGILFAYPTSAKVLSK